MEDEKPIREFDRLVLRVPDGFKERLEQRARAHGRSMNGEAVMILSAAIDAPDVLGLRALEDERKRLREREDDLKRSLTDIQERYRVVNREIMDRREDAKKAGLRRTDATTRPYEADPAAWYDHETKPE